MLTYDIRYTIYTDNTFKILPINLKSISQNTIFKNFSKNKKPFKEDIE